MTSMETYGEAKAACEQAVLNGFGSGRVLIARAGLIGGPGDPTGRSSYWPWRFAHPSNPDDAVLVPDDPEAPTGVIDVRDLATWLVHCIEAGTTGIFNVAGETVPLADHLAIARAVARHAGPVVAATPSWLADNGVDMWMGPRSMPLWIGDPDFHGLIDRNTARARAAGLTTRPLRDTLTGALDWEEDRPSQGPHGAGLTDDDEQRLLESLAAARR